MPTELIVGIVGPSLTLLGVWLVARSSRKSKRDDIPLEIIDDLREQLAAERAARESLDAKVTAQINRLWELLRVRDDYIAELRQHIEKGNPPPPPPYPAALTGGL